MKRQSKPFIVEVKGRGRRSAEQWTLLATEPTEAEQTADAETSDAVSTREPPKGRMTVGQVRSSARKPRIFSA